MTNITEPTPEEHAWHEGWRAYYDNDETPVNPYDSKNEQELHETWKAAVAFAVLTDN